MWSKYPNSIHERTKHLKLSVKIVNFKNADFCKLLKNVSWKELEVQEVPAFCDFWYQKGITKFGDLEF